MRISVLVTLLLSLCLAGSGGLTLLHAGPTHAATLGGEPIAEIAGQPVTWSELESFAADQLREIDKKRHQILEASLTGLIEQKLLEREANRRKVTIAELLATEVDQRIEPVTDRQVDAWYEQNRAKVRQPKEAIAGQVRSFLSQQRTDPVRRELLAGLRERYGVKVLFEPLRVDIEPTDGPAAGPEDATVTVTEFIDFQCPPCKGLQPDLSRLKEAYSDRVRFAFRQFPLTSIHPQAWKAAEAALCAEDQGKFWQMHDALFAHQRELGVDQIKTRASEIGLDTQAFNQCLDSNTHRDQVQADMQAGRRAGVSGTPTIFVNGRPVPLLRGASPFDLISATIDDEIERTATR